MGKIFIEKKEIRHRVRETVEETTFEIIDGTYTENTKLNRKYISDIYSYVDFNVMFSMENLYDQYYNKIILFNEEKNIKYNLISLPDYLDVSVKRISPRNFLILGINKDQEKQGQASFCSIQNNGTVNEISINFNYINQYKVIEKKYFILNFIEVFKNDLGQPQKYVNTISVYRVDGSILKVLIEESLPEKRELVCEVDGGNILIYYKDDGSVVKNIPISEVLLSND